MMPSAASSAVKVPLLYCTQSMTSGRVPLLRTERFPAGATARHSLRIREDLPVHLEFARPAEEEVEFLVISVDMQETAFRSGHERLEREFAAGGLYGCAAEHLSGNFHSGTEFHNIVVQFV